MANPTNKRRNPLIWIKARPILVARRPVTVKYVKIPKPKIHSREWELTPFRYEDERPLGKHHEIGNDWPFLLRTEEIAIFQYPVNNQDEFALRSFLNDAINKGILIPDEIEKFQFVPDRPPILNNFISPSSFLNLFNGFDEPSEFIQDWFNAWLENEQDKDLSEDKEESEISQAINSDDWKNDTNLMKGERQRIAILEAISLKGYAAMEIPDGGKGVIKQICENDYPDFFNCDTSFDNAWDVGRYKYWRMANHAGYAKRGK